MPLSPGIYLEKCNFRDMHIIIIATLLCIVPTNCVKIDPFACPLEWVSGVEGNSLPAKAVYSDITNKVAIVRGVDDAGSTFYGGRIGENGQAYIILVDKSIANISNFEILSNPHNCVTTWKKSSINFPWYFDNSTPFIVARVLLDSFFFPGNGRLSNVGQIEVVNERLEYSVINSANVEFLTSYSKGLTLALTEFDMGDNDPFQGSKDILGTDEIINGGETEIRQTIVHRKKTVEIIRIATRSFSTFTASLSAYVNPSFKLNNKLIGNGDGDDNLFVRLTSASLGFNIAYDFTTSQEVQTDLYKHKETDVTITREVIVPPYTAVQICSIINTEDDFEADYTAKGTYSAPGLTGQEIQALLAREGKSGQIEDDTVIVEESGTIGGTLYLTTQFIVVPIDPATGEGGCSQVMAGITRLKRIKALRHSSRPDNYESLVNNQSKEIDKWIQGFASRKI